MEVVATGEPFSFETVFHAHYERIARAIGRIVRDPARAEERVQAAPDSCR